MMPLQYNGIIEFINKKEAIGIEYQLSSISIYYQIQSVQYLFMHLISSDQLNL